VSRNGRALSSQCFVDELVSCQYRILRNGDKSPTELFPTPVGPMTLLKHRHHYNEMTRHKVAHAMMMSSVKAENRPPFELGILEVDGRLDCKSHSSTFRVQWSEFDCPDCWTVATCKSRCSGSQPHFSVNTKMALRMGELF
jgi:hypothetical protein